MFEDERTNETRTEDDEEGDGHDQVPGVKQKWKLLPHFLKLRGLMRQHIDSYDYFVNVDISKVNQGIHSRHNRTGDFFLAGKAMVLAVDFTPLRIKDIS